LLGSLAAPLAAALLTLGTAAPAFAQAAQPAPLLETEGERLFREGRLALLDGRLAEACPKLEKSQALEPHVGTLLNVAACHERQGKVGSAWVEYQKALTSARTEGQADRERLATERLAVLTPRVPWLRVTSDSDDVIVSLDGAELSRAAWAQELPMDPGMHDVTAMRAGNRVFAYRLELLEADHREVQVTARPKVAPPVADTIVVDPPASQKPEPAPAKPEGRATAGRWFLEPGLFLGYVRGSSHQGYIQNPEDVTFQESARPGSTESCGTVRCASQDVDSGGAGAGVNVAAGYALTDSFSISLRLVASPALSRTANSIYAFGPGVAFRATEALSLGVWGLYGDAGLSAKTWISPPSGYTGQTSVATVEGELGGGFGAGVEATLRLFELKRGSVVATTTPFFIGGSVGSAFCLPIGLAFHYQ